MRALLRTILCVSILAPALADARVLGQSRRAGGARPRAAAQKPNGRASSFEERRSRYAALVQVRDGLRKYLSTLDATAAEHAATSKTLKDVEAKVASLEKSLLATLASPTGEAAGAADPTPPDPEPDAQREATEQESAAARPAPRTAGGRLRGAENPNAPRAERAGLNAAADNAEAPPGNGNGNGRDSAAEADQEPTPEPTPEATPEPTPEPTPEAAPESFSVWLNRRVEEKTIALINQGSNANQTESPSASEGSTALVDQSSASDLVGVALNLAGLSTGTNDDKDVNAATVTVSAYSLFSAFKGADPLDPAFYNKHEKWRRFSLTLGFDNEKIEGDEGATDRVTLAGFKWLIVNGRDASNNRNADQRGIIINALAEAAGAFGRLDQDIKGFLFRSKSVRATLLRNAFRDFLDEEVVKLNAEIVKEQARISELERRARPLSAADRTRLAQLEAAAEERTLTNVEKRDLRRLKPLQGRMDELKKQQERLAKVLDLKNKDFDTLLQPENSANWSQAEINFANIGFRRILLQSADSFDKVREALSDAERETLDKYIDARIDPFVKLKGGTRQALEEIRARPQFSFAALAKRRQQGADEYTSDVIYERGLGTRTFATFNAGFKYKDSKVVGGDSRGGQAAAQLQFQVTPEESLVGKSPLYLYLSSDAEWMSGVKPKYRAQAKVKVPVADGIEIPISVTFANRTDLIDETDIRGQFGFTFDTAKLLRAFKFKLPTFGQQLLTFAPLLIPKPRPQTATP